MSAAGIEPAERFRKLVGLQRTVVVGFVHNYIEHRGQLVLFLSLSLSPFLFFFLVLSPFSTYF